MLNVSVLDQSPVTFGMSAAEAIANTLDLAQLADRCGYHRYWVAEHHNAPAFASASPEILLARIASLTARIRVGAAGILLGHYSSLKVAEQFNLLEVLFPGRLDLGVGRGAGSDPRATAALRPGGDPAEDFFERFDALIGYLGRGSRKLKADPLVNAVPRVASRPTPWVLGTGPTSAAYAARRGLPFAFACFIHNEHLAEATQRYVAGFQPSRYLERPCLALAVAVVCSASDAQAQRLVKPFQAWLVESLTTGKNLEFPTVADVAQRCYTDAEHLLVERYMQTAFVGDAPTVAERLQGFASQHGADEIVAVTITEQHEDRVQSYRLLSEALGVGVSPTSISIKPPSLSPSDVSPR